MTIQEQLKALEEKKTSELFFKEVTHLEIKKGDLSVRDESGINPVYLREVTYEEAAQRIQDQVPVNIVTRDSKLGRMYLEGIADEN